MNSNICLNINLVYPHPSQRPRQQLGKLASRPQKPSSSSIKHSDDNSDTNEKAQDYNNNKYVSETDLVPRRRTIPGF